MDGLDDDPELDEPGPCDEGVSGLGRVSDERLLKSESFVGFRCFFPSFSVGILL